MANTTNLDLVKPAGTDKAQISVINGNMDKIDAWAGTTNTAIGTYSLGSVASLSAFETALNTYISGLIQNDFRNIVVEFSVASSPFTNARYIGTVSKTTSARAQVTLHLHNGQQIIHGIQNSTSWDWKQLAFATEQSSATISTLKYDLIGNMMLVCGYFAGDGTSEITTGLGNYSGTVNARNTSTGVMSLYFHSSNKIKGWDGSSSRLFTSGQNYEVRGILYKE